MKLLAAVIASLAVTLPAYATDSLPLSLLSRTIWSVSFAMERSPQHDDTGSAWHYVAVGDGWDWELTHDTTVEYRRNINPNAKIVLENIQVTDIGAFQWGPPVVVSEDVKERRLVPVRLHTGSSYVVKTAEAFTKTTSLEESARVGLELAMETHFGYKASTTTGGLEGGGSISAKATAEYSRKWGSSTSTTESADRALTINGPFVGQAEMVRSISKISRTITTPPTLEHQIIVYDGDTELYRWNTFAELLLVLQGAAPTDRALSKKFYKAPLSQTELHAIFAHQSIAPVTWTALYDNVVTEPIKEVMDVEQTRELIKQEADLRPATEQTTEEMQEAIRQAISQHDAERRERRQAKRDRRRGNATTTEQAPPPE